MMKQTLRPLCLLLFLPVLLQAQSASKRRVQFVRSTWTMPRPVSTTAVTSPLAATSSLSRLSFAEAGYTDQTLQGLSGTSTYYLRLPPGATLQGSQLTLFLTPSQALQPNNSTVTILIGGQPVMSRQVSQLVAGSTVASSPVLIPLTGSQPEPNNPFLRVDVKTQLAITDDRCKDLENPALWLRVNKASFVTYQQPTGGGSRLNLSNCLATKTAIVYPADPSPTDARLVSALYCRMNELRPGRVALYPANRLPDSLTNIIVVGEVGHIADRFRPLLNRQPQAQQGLLVLRAGSSQHPEVLFITGQTETGYAKTIGAVSNVHVLASAFGEFLTVDKASSEPDAQPQTNRLTFTQLGGQPILMQGLGSLRQLYGFRLSDFTQQPAELETHLEARYSGLQPADRGYLNLYVNDVLFSSTLLDKSGLISISPKLKRYLLKPFNTLQVEFRFFPGTDVCRNSFLNFFAQVDVQHSFIRSTDQYSSEYLSFLQYPGSFQNKPLSLVVSKSLMSQALPGVCELVRQLNLRPATHLTIPAVYLPETYTSAKPTGNLMAVLDRNDPLWTQFTKAPVQFQQNFRLYADNQNQPLFTVSDSVACGIAQIFRQGDQNVLLLSNNGPASAGAFLNTTRHLTDPLTNLASNVLITAGPQHYLFNLTDPQDGVDYYDSSTERVFDWWAQYNLYILGVLLVLILLAFLYVRSKVKVSQAIFDN